jgi:hypothetical protein
VGANDRRAPLKHQRTAMGPALKVVRVMKLLVARRPVNGAGSH